MTKIGEWGICKRNPSSSPRVEDLGQENGYEANEELELGNLLTTVSRGAWVWTLLNEIQGQYGGPIKYMTICKLYLLYMRCIIIVRSFIVFYYLLIVVDVQYR